MLLSAADEVGVAQRAAGEFIGIKLLCSAQHLEVVTGAAVAVDFITRGE